MEKHPKAVEGACSVPWEPLGQVSPDKLPEPSETYPGPWTTQDRGNGHTDVYDAKGRYFAHVYLWDAADWGVLSAKLKAASAG